jgi:hypothetical protein
MTGTRSITPLLSWQEFLDTADRPPSIPFGAGRDDNSQWAGGSYEEAARLAVDGWHVDLPGVDVAVGELRERAGLSRTVTALEPTWDVSGSEVDVGVYLSGVPECMVDAVPRRTSVRGRVVTFLVPAGFVNTIPHQVIINRGLALATLCSAIIEAGHSVEVWSGFAAWLDPGMGRFVGVARVLAAGEPLDIGRLTFASAHPAMLRRLWFSVMDAQDADFARDVALSQYGCGPYDCTADDLPSEIRDPYVFPYLDEDDAQWDTLDSSLEWSRRMFAELGLLAEV